VLLFDVRTSRMVDRLPDLGDGPLTVSWSDDGSTLTAGSDGAGSAVWDATTGEVKILMPNTGPAALVLFDSASERLVHFGPGAVTLWDISGEVAGAENSSVVGPRVLIQAQSVTASPNRGAFLFREDNWHVGTFSPSTGELESGTIPTAMGRATAVLDDGRVLVFLREGSEEDELVGPLAAWDPESGDLETVLGCQARWNDLPDVDHGEPTRGTCLNGEPYFDFDRALRSEDGSTLAISSLENEVLFLDPVSLEIVETVELPVGAETIRSVGPDWLATSDFDTGLSTPLRTISLYSLDGMSHLATFPGNWAQSDNSGSQLAIDTGPGQVTIADTATGEVIAELEAGTGRVRGLAFSPGDDLLMTSATDGFMRIWDLASGDEIERVPLGDGVAGSGDGHWIDENTIAVALFDGLWTNIDIGLEPLLDLARSRLLRTFTEAECDTYKIDPCPSMDEMRSG
jgi:WD40 repeat protein